VVPPAPDELLATTLHAFADAGRIPPPERS
jgi:hypothetical protein